MCPEEIFSNSSGLSLGSLSCLQQLHESEKYRLFIFTIVNVVLKLHCNIFCNRFFSGFTSEKEEPCIWVICNGDHDGKLLGWLCRVYVEEISKVLSLADSEESDCGI